MSNGPFVPAEGKEGEGEDGEPQTPKSLPRGAVKLAERSRSQPFQLGWTRIKPQNGRVLKSPLEPPPLTPGGDRKRGLGGVVSWALTFPLPPPSAHLAPSAPGPTVPQRPGRPVPAKGRCGHAEPPCAPAVPGRWGASLGAPSAGPPLPPAPKPTFRANFSWVLLLKICKTFPLMPSPRTWVVTL